MASNTVTRLRESKILNYAEEKVLLDDAKTNPRKVISICHRKCLDENREDVYYDAIRECTQIKDINRATAIFDKIFSLNALSHITTNIDLGLKNYILETRQTPTITIYNCTCPNDRRVIEQKQFNIFRDGSVVYLHGNTDRLQDSILTANKYLAFYNENNAFLNGLFSHMKLISEQEIIIFLGYSLSEWDIIERIYKLKEGINKTVVGLLLSPIFSSELTDFNLEQEYYKSFGVRAIPYIIDDEGYEKINLVLGNLANAIASSRASPFEIFSQIEGVNR